MNDKNEAMNDEVTSLFHHCSVFWRGALRNVEQLTVSLIKPRNRETPWLNFSGGSLVLYYIISLLHFLHFFLHRMTVVGQP